MSSISTPAKYYKRSVDATTREQGVILTGTADDRRVLNATNTTSAPSSSSDGFDISGAESLYIKLKATTNNCTVKLWEWDASSEEWAENDTLGAVSLTAGASTTLVGAECNGSHRAYLQVATAVGAGTFEGWCRLILRDPGAR
jgi:hypothetical protein